MSRMSRQNHIAFVEHLYRFYPNFSDSQILCMVNIAFNETNTTKNTLSVWKARLRKRGLDLPDKRKKGEPNEPLNL